MSVEKSAGLVLILNNEEILLAHPSRAPWKKSYSIPKGKIEKGESDIDAAIRETKEEVGIDIPRDLVDPDNSEVVEYRSRKGKLYKKVFAFYIHINSLEDIGLTEKIIDTENLQLDEVDWAGFMPYDEAKDKIFRRFTGFLDKINKSHSV